MVSFLGFEFGVASWVLSIGVFFLAFFIGRILRVFLDNILRALVSKTKTTLDDRLIAALNGPLDFLFVVIGAFLAIQISIPEFELGGVGLQKMFGLALIAVAGSAVAEVANAFVKWYMTELSVKGKTTVREDLFPILRKIVRFSIYLSTLIILLSELGVEIAPLLAGLGIAGLAVALALQSTLSNFFSGLYLLTDKPIRVGDRISLDSETGLTGNVEQIGWRTTRIRAFTNVLYIMPNEKLANAVIINYDLSKENGRLAVLKIGVSYDSDVEKVEKALRQVHEELKQKNQAVLADFDPIIRFDGFGDFSLNFIYVFKTANYIDRFQALGDANKLVLEKFRKNKIEIPYPVRTILVKK